jgi:hypothetical protein
VILLDTNVLSELMQRHPSGEVVGWLDSQPPDDIWTSTISVFEVRFGLELLADGRRRRAMQDAFRALCANDLAGRIAVFDSTAAEAAAALAARRRKDGRTVDLRDTQIAGIAIARRAAIATRNVRHFQDLDVPVVDPWSRGRI